MSRRWVAVLSLAILAASLAGLLYWLNINKDSSKAFNGDRAYADVKEQVSFGPRTVGSSAHEQFVNWLTQSLVETGWQVQIQKTEMMGHPIQNIVASRGSGVPQIMLLAHYDSRLVADNDPNPDNRSQPVPGANDGASGVAILLELARVLPKDTVPVWLVFLDAEDNGRIPGWDWILGSRAFVPSLVDRPKAAVLVDMVGDAALNIYMEKNSDKALTEQIWGVAGQLGYSNYFLPQYKYQVIDDHVPFLEAGIPAVDLIDLNYPYWHTLQDTPDKVSPKSLAIVGRTLLQWLILQK